MPRSYLRSLTSSNCFPWPPKWRSFQNTLSYTCGVSFSRFLGWRILILRHGWTAGVTMTLLAKCLVRLTNFKKKISSNGIKFFLLKEYTMGTCCVNFFTHEVSRFGAISFWMFKNETFLNWHISATIWLWETQLTFLETSIWVLTLWLLFFWAIRSSSPWKLKLKYR